MTQTTDPIHVPVHNGFVFDAPETLDTGYDLGSRDDSRLARIGKPLARWWAALRAVPNIATYVGVAVTGIGMILLVVAWGKTAGLTVVSLQIPYLVSAGLTGVALVAVGLTIVNLSAKQADARERAQQAAELRALLSEVRKAAEEGLR